MASSTISVTRSAAFRAASDCDPRMRSSSFATVREFWIREGAVPLDTGGNTILHFLAMYGNAFVIQKLVDDDENSNKSSSSGIVKCEDLLWRNDMGNTPLHEAARFGRKSVVEILLRKQESLARERNSLGETPVYVAAACGHEDVYDHLIAKVDHHPEIMTRSTDNSNLLHAAVMGEHYGTYLHRSTHLALALSPCLLRLVLLSHHFCRRDPLLGDSGFAPNSQSWWWLLMACCESLRRRDPLLGDSGFAPNNQSWWWLLMACRKSLRRRDPHLGDVGFGPKG
ncbi:hypothetical protein C3L33_10991, partial [Rhododendron williamsianum]